MTFARRTVLLLLIALEFSISANGQFFSLATSADGSRVYFVTTLRQKGTMQTSAGKLFQLDARGLSLAFANETQGSEVHDIIMGDVSADGQTVTASYRHCTASPNACGNVEPSVTILSKDGVTQKFPGLLHLSAGGGWAFGATWQPVDLETPIHGYLVNVTSGEMKIFGSANSHGFYPDIFVAGSGRSVADDGTAVYSDGSSVKILRGDDVRTISATALPNLIADAVIDSFGQTIIYSDCTETTLGGPNNFHCIAGSLRRADPTGSGSTLLVQDGYAPSISDDGARVVYLSNRTGKAQVRVIDLVEGIDRQLSEDASGIQSATLSGDGRVAFVVSKSGRLFRIPVVTAAAEEIIPRTPFLAPNQYFHLAPGKLTPLIGSGFSDSTAVSAPPLPLSLGGVQVTIQGQPARILSVSPSELMVLVPPNIVPGRGNIVLTTTASTSPFEGPELTADVSTFYAQFLTVDAMSFHALTLAAHEDWSALLSSENPARPGEVIHAYAVGLGPTTPAVPYGEGSPVAEPLARLTTPIECTSSPLDNVPIQFLFQGLAPGMAGVYQVDLLVPDGAPSGQLQPQCRILGGRFPVRSNR